MSALVAVAAIVLLHSEFYLESKGGYGQDITGQVSVIDGDTLKMRSARIRLEGIDAPENDQKCAVQGQEYLCGRYATRALANKIANRPVTCKRRGRDQYDRILAVCFVGEENVNEWMVAQGWARPIANILSRTCGWKTRRHQPSGGCGKGNSLIPGTGGGGSAFEERNRRRPLEVTRSICF